MKDWTTKDLRKAAFAVGFGFYFGREVAKFVDQVVAGTFIGVIKESAKNGNKFAQNVCEKNGVDYKEEPKKDDNGVKMGFHM